VPEVSGREKMLPHNPEIASGTTGTGSSLAGAIGIALPARNTKDRIGQRKIWWSITKRIARRNAAVTISAHDLQPLSLRRINAIRSASQSMAP
jgi:hypothetical protein